MRTVGRIQFRADGAQNAQPIWDTLKAWQERKFRRQAGVDVVIARSGTAATFEEFDAVVGEASLRGFTLVEPVDDGALRTTVRVLSSPEGLAFSCELAAASSVGLSLLNLRLSPPRFVGDIAACGLSWHVPDSDERILSTWVGIPHAEVPTFLELLSSDRRRLPLVLVSELEGDVLGGDLHALLSRDLCGLAHVCRISEDASWELTRQLGKGWSCFGGAVRVYWPLRGALDTPFNHPLRTAGNILGLSDDKRQALDKFRRIIGRQLLEASAFLAEDSLMRRFESERIRQKEDAFRAEAQQRNDWQALAESYALENSKLRADVDQAESDLAQLREENANLLNALRSLHDPERNSVTREEADGEVADVASAIRAIRTTHTEVISFDPQVDEHARSLHRNAGPPSKVKRYLEGLANLSRELARNPQGGLGMSVIQWLRRRNIEGSIESETVSNSPTQRRLRTWRVDGQEVFCPLHLKPSDEVAPDLCVRIYFTVRERAPHVHVTYVGRHF